MADGQRRLILGNGEQYIRPISKRMSNRPTEPPRSYGDARDIVKRGLTTALNSFEALPAQKKLLEEPVFCLRLHPDVTAKTYSPTAIFEEVPDVRPIGSRNYRTAINEVAPTRRIEKQKALEAADVSGRLIFVQSSPEGFDRFLRHLDRVESQLKKSFRDEIRRIERFDMLGVTEQILGFSETWDEGRAELVLHPTRSGSERQLEFVFELFDEAGVDRERSRIRQYPSGPTFISCRLNREALNLLAGTNPLRTAHPLAFGGLPSLRNATRASAPLPSIASTRSTIKVGMFDGGIDPSVPLLVGHAEEDTSLEIATARDPDCVSHGTAVAGALLYGALNGKTTLAAPPVYVVSIRALPTSDPLDIDLYESIDVIEQTIPARKDIKVYNISFGPRGPIEYDTLSRFTYVLDSLAVAHKVTFFVAVGNDGDIPQFDRIQAPSDLVHGVGVGAYTMDDNGFIHAPYSSRGPGRECGKMKPDVSAFGGCENRPIHLVSTVHGEKLLDWGTSFATPLATRLGGQASECFEQSSALLARALLVHTAAHPGRNPDHLLGHGCVGDPVDDMLTCQDGTVTVVYRGEILPTSFVRLPVPWPADANIPGKFHISWTIAALSPIDPNHPGDYTSCCLEETFYPNAKVFTFSPPQDQKGRTAKLHVDKDASAIAALIAQGWKQPDFPATDSGNAYRDEKARRLDCKWEPLVRRSLTKYAENIFDPFLTLHAIGRNAAVDRFEYVTIVTVAAPKFDGDLYTLVRTRFPALVPIRLRSEAEIRVRI